MNKKQITIVSLLALACVLAAVYFFMQKADNANQSGTLNDTNSELKETIQTESNTLDKTLYDINQPGSPWWVVNKHRPLPAGYVPSDLAVPEVKLRLAKTAPQMPFSKSATPALIEMFTAAKNDGVTLVFGSGYRSEELQRQFYSQYVAQDGQAAADRYSARPGTSEHQTGLSFDATNISEICHLEICFESTPEGSWLKENAYKYGFIVRYPDLKEAITGYQYEPWHMRYVGKELSMEMHETGIQTLEEFFGLSPAPDYLN